MSCPHDPAGKNGLTAETCALCAMPRGKRRRRIRRKRTHTEPPIARPTCIHLGPEIMPPATPTGERCLCAGKSVRECEVHGRCTLTTKYDGTACCAGCPDKQTEHLPETVDEVLADIAGPEKPRTREWCQSPVVIAAHIEAAKRHLEAMPDYPGDRSGRVYITCGGGKKYSPGIYLQIRMLRRFNQTLPVQVWHRGSEEPLPKCIGELPGVTIVDAEQHPARPTWRVLAGWPLKLIAGIYSGAEAWLFSDADNYCVSDPEVCFDHNPTGAVLWPDQAGCDRNCKWHSFGLEPPQPNHGTNGGTELFDLRRAWRPVMLSHWFDMHREFYYQERHGVGGYGEQDARRAAFPLTGQTYTLYGERPRMRGQIFLQVGPDGTPMFVHRIQPKPSVIVRRGVVKPGFGKRHWLPMENEVHEIMADFRW